MQISLGFRAPGSETWSSVSPGTQYRDALNAVIRAPHHQYEWAWSRRSVPGGASCSSNAPPDYPGCPPTTGGQRYDNATGYVLTGSQTAEFSFEYPALPVPSSHYPAAGDTVLLSAVLRGPTNPQSGYPRWYFHANDTLPTAKGTISGATWLTGCNGRWDCSHTPLVPGRYYVHAWYLGGGGQSWSDVVWAGRAPPPGLQLMAEPTEVVPGTLVTFTPVAGGEPIEVLSWTWTANDTTSAGTAACAPGTNPCVTPVYDAGTMRVQARLDGVVHEAEAHVDVRIPDLVLTATPAQVWEGDTISFHATAEGSLGIQTLEWSWMAADPGPPQTQVCGAGENPCAQPVHEDGTMTVRALVFAVEQSASAGVSAVNRCPMGEPFLTDSVVVERFREMWYYSYPDSALAKMKERIGFIVQKPDGSYDVEWVPRLADACNVLDGPDPLQPPPGTIAWAHTQPAPPGTLIPPGVCVLRPLGMETAAGASLPDQRWGDLLSVGVGKEVPGFILETTGLTRFDSTNPAGVPFPMCNVWQTGIPDLSL